MLSFLLTSCSCRSDCAQLYGLSYFAIAINPDFQVKLVLKFKKSGTSFKNGASSVFYFFD